MQQKSFGKLPPVSLLTLGGGGLGMLWGETNFDECVATVHAAVEAGIELAAKSLDSGAARRVLQQLVARTNEPARAEAAAR